MKTHRYLTFSFIVRLANLWLCIHRPTTVHSAPQTCSVLEASCVYDTLNVSADGLQRLRASAREYPSTYQITVERLITPHPDGVLLHVLSEFAQEVVYEQYNERVLRIPPKATLKGITIRNASELRMITVAAPNYQLISVQINHASLARISDTFRNLRGIQFLILENGALETLSLDPFANSPQLLSLGCSVNRISQLIPSRNASLIVPITDLMLAYNRLESISGDFFRPLRMLEYVTLDSNRIQCIEGSPISLPQVRYISLVQNQLSQLDVSEWHVPRLIEIYLESNNLTRVPAGIERLPNLTTLVLQNNLLKVVDLRRFDGCTKLIKIDLSGNRLRNVVVSGTGRISLPNVVMVHLTNNQLTQLEYARWDFPQLNTLTIALNGFNHLPDLFQIFPKLKRVLALHNPLHCSTVRQWEQYIVDFKLSVDTTAFGMPCITNAMLKLPSGRELCCVE